MVVQASEITARQEAQKRQIEAGDSGADAEQEFTEATLETAKAERESAEV